jgi:hypothetical protein
MQSKNKPAPNKREAEHIVRVKALDCSVCDQPGPGDAHEIRQGQWYTAVALCHSCHQGPLLGLHGQRRMWALKKMDELDALAVTIERLLRGAWSG